jgi:hypothetical protein
MKGYRAIARVGVEIEGGWSHQPYGYREDHSVETFDSAISGEAVSRPYASLPKLLAWQERNWPTEVNGTCGYHVHVSFRKPGYYDALVQSDTLLTAFVDHMTEWGKTWGVRNINFFNRLDGRNGYCWRVWNATDQIAAYQKDSCRYALLNFCWSLHGTLECRAFPAFKRASTAAAVLTEYLNFINSEALARAKAYRIRRVATTATADLRPYKKEDKVCV